MRRVRRNGQDEATTFDPRDVEKRVLDLLETEGHPLTTIEIADRLHEDGVPGQAVTRAVLNLIERRQIHRTRTRRLEAA